MRRGGYVVEVSAKVKDFNSEGVESYSVGKGKKKVQE